MKYIIKLFLLLVTTIQVLHASEPDLTEQEKQWIKNNPIIKVQSIEDSIPYNFVKDGKPMGYSLANIKLIASKVGLKVEIVQGNSWNKSMELLKSGQIDVMPNIVKTKSREKFFAFTTAYTPIMNVMYVKDGTFHPKSLDDLSGKTLSITKGFSEIQLLQKYYPNIKLHFTKDGTQAFKLLSLGKVDATSYSLGAGNKIILKNALLDIVPAFEIKNKIFLTNLHIATSKKNKILRDILQKGLDARTTKEKDDLKRKWLLSQFNNSVKSNTIALTNKEKNYLSAKTNLAMCVDPDWLPFEKINKEGKYKGVGSDIVKMVSKKINKRIVLIPTSSWTQTMKNFIDKKCDIIPVATKTPSRLKTMNFTNPYIKKPLVVATNKDRFFIKDSGDLLHKKIGVVKDYAFIELLKQKQPTIDIVTVNNVREGLKKVQNGELFGFVDALPTIAYAIQQEGIVDLKVAGRLEFDVELSIASQKDEPLLNTIMQKALNDIDKEQIDSIVGKWISIKVEQSFNYRVLIYIVIVFLIILVFMLYRQSIIKKMNKKLEMISITDALTHIYNRRYFNDLFPKIIKSAKRKDELVSFAIMDIDYFKQYNDTYGHQMGDDALVKVAKVMKDSLHRADDYCFRLGGEEFGVVFKADSKEKAIVFANTIKDNIENLHIEHSYNSASPYVTASMGLVCKNASDIKNSDDIYKQSDDLLYKAKESGRNRVAS